MYFADLDMIENIEKRKDGYESDVSDEGIDEDSDDDMSNGLSAPKRVEKDSSNETPQAQTINNSVDSSRDSVDGDQKFKSVRRYFGPEEDIYIMDAMTQGNIGRYLNHSCDPNVFVQNVFVESHDIRFPTIAFFTMKYVAAGEELCWNYNYVVDSVENKQIICNCGASNCKGRLL